MTTQLLRILLIAFCAILIQSSFNVTNMFALSKQIQYPLIIALTPYIISKLPVLGTRDLMSAGTQPLFSLIFMVGCTIVIQYIVKEIKQSNQIDFLSKFLKDEDLSFGDFKLKNDFVFILVCVLLCDLILQMYSAKNKYNHIEKAVTRALEKFHSKKK